MLRLQRARITYGTPRGWFTWLDGNPPQVAISERPRADSARILAESASVGSSDAVGGAPLYVSILLGPRRQMPDPMQLLRLIGKRGASEVELRLMGQDALAVWDSVQNWLLMLEKHLEQTQASLQVTYVVDTALREVPEGLCAFGQSNRG